MSYVLWYIVLLAIVYTILLFAYKKIYIYELYHLPFVTVSTYYRHNKVQSNQNV